MAAPVVVILDRGGGAGPLDLTPLLRGDSIRWSSVVPGGFGSCNFQLDGDFRTLVKQVPYLSILRVIGDSGRVLFEGQIEDLAPTLSTSAVGLKVGAFGLQNILKETTVRTIWSKRDLSFQIRNPAVALVDPAFNVTTGNFDPSDLSKSGVEFIGTGTLTSRQSAGRVNQQLWVADPGLTIQRVAYTYDKAGNANLATDVYYSTNHTSYTSIHTSATNIVGSAQNLSTPNAVEILFGLTATPADFTTAITDFIKFYDIRVLGQINEDIADGFYGDTLIKNLLTLLPATQQIGQGVIEPGSDFKIDHLDASVRRTCYDVLQEIVSYYTREWAVWEDALLHWRTPQMSQPQWIIPISQLTTLDLDASTINSQNSITIQYVDAASGRNAELTGSSSDRRNPYTLRGKFQTELLSTGFPMTSSTATQLAAKVIQNVGYGPVPAAGTISLHGETIVQHAQGNAVKAWEIRAGDNVTIPELPLADVFTQDGRGECLFHIVAAEASASDGLVTLTLDSYGSKRSDVLLARLAAVTHALGG